MKMHIRRAVTFLGLIGAIANTAFASKFVIVLHTSEGWRLQGAEKIAINGKVKIRRGEGAKPEVGLDAYRRLPQEVPGSAPLRLHRGGYLVERSGAAWNPIFPDGANFKGSATAQSLWSSAQVVYQVDKTTKDQAFRSADVFAILPGTATPAEAAVVMLSDEANFRGLGESTPAEAFDDRMAMLVGIAGVADASALDKLKGMLATAMTTAIQRSGNGNGRFAEITQGLRFAEVSEKAFPADPQQTTLRNTLREKKAWVDQRIAIVKAFSAGGEWDPLIDKYGDFEQYDEAFADLRQLHDKSFKESEAFHTVEARRLYGESLSSCAPALEHLKLARVRNPGSRELETLQRTMRIACSNVGEKLPRKPLTRAELIQIQTALTLSDSYLTDNKFREVEAEIATAESVRADWPSVVLARAKLLRAQRAYPQAIEMLDRYDNLPFQLTDEEVRDGTTLRTRITYEVTSGRDTARTETTKSETEGDYIAALKQARAGLQFDPNDPELLYSAGLDAAITRNAKDARQFWQDYLAASQSLSAESKRRSEVQNLLGEISVEPKAPAGMPNWFSNSNVAPGLMYDPVSLAPNFHPSEAKASGKEATLFDWRDGVLLSVKTTSLLPKRAAPAASFYFDYFPGHKGVRRVATEPFDEKADPGLPKLTADGAVGAGKGTYVALFSDPAVNPFLVEKLTGKRVATIVAGNPWFQPFVWTEVHSFLAEYDAEGRVKSAKPLNARGGAKTLDFVWAGNKLISIGERAGDYKREMKYDGDRLMGETVQYRGKTSKIGYKYNGGRLIEADCDVDFSLDQKSRHVVFGTDK